MVEMTLTLGKCAEQIAVSESLSVDDYAGDGSQRLGCGVLRPGPQEDRGGGLPL